MAVFSTNQNRQLYVVEGIEQSLAAIKPANKLGYAYVGEDAEGCKFINQHGYGGIVISDLVNPDKIMWATASAPKDTEQKLKAVTISLNTDFNSGNLVDGEDYILRINFRQMYGMSDEDIYQKYGAVHVTSSSKSLFWKKMIYSLIKNFSRLYNPLVEIGVSNKSNIVAKATKDSAGSIHLYKADGTEIDVNDLSTLYIAEKSQVDEWALGTKQLVPVYFDIVPTTVVNAQGVEGVWGTVTPVTGNDAPAAIPNGYKYADLEYFCMGERGDQYRMVGWPKVIKTNYFITDPNTEWYCLDIHYAYQGTCEDIQKSEKTLTILSEDLEVIQTLIGQDGFDIEDKVTKTDNFTADVTAAEEAAGNDDNP